MKVSEAIDRLEVGDTVWVKLKADGFDDIGAPLKVASPIDCDYMWIHENDEISLTEPQGEKVEVSQEFADWVEKAKTVKDGLDYKNWCVKEIATIGWGNWLHDPERILDGKVIYDEWVNAVADNKEKHIKAIYDGYTVKPKRWVVRHEAGKFFEKFTGNGISRAWVVWKSQAYIFTDKSKAEAVATLVDGSVEEV